MEFIKRDPKIFILSGQARSGKNQVAKIIENYYNNLGKKTITIAFAYYLKDYVKRITNWDGNDATKPRDFLQQLGIELIKNKIDDKLLINRVIEDIKVFSYFYDIIIISDARLIDEIEVLKNEYNNAITIRVIRDKSNSSLTLEQQNHITETALDNYDNFDYKLYNENYNKLVNDVEDILRSNI